MKSIHRSEELFGPETNRCVGISPLRMVVKNNGLVTTPVSHHSGNHSAMAGTA